MKKVIVITTLALSFAAQASAATKSNYRASTEENVGAASGALIGAAAAGPVGFILGAAFGAVLGNEVEEAKQVEVLASQLDQEKANSQELTQKVNYLNTELANQTAEITQQQVDLLQIDLLFHTGNSDLDDIDRSKVIKLAEFLDKYPTMTIQLDGFADPRGLAEDNLALSKQRIDSVKALLVDWGINEERIISNAHGESAAIVPEGDLDAYAYERRVSVSLMPTATGSLANN